MFVDDADWPSKVEDVRVSPGTKKLLVRMKSDFGLETMTKPDVAAMTAVDNGGRIKGDI